MGRLLRETTSRELSEWMAEDRLREEDRQVAGLAREAGDKLDARTAGRGA